MVGFLFLFFFDYASTTCLLVEEEKCSRELLIQYDTCFAVCQATPSASVAPGLFSGEENDIRACLELTLIRKKFKDKLIPPSSS